MLYVHTMEQYTSVKMRTIATQNNMHKSHNRTLSDKKSFRKQQIVVYLFCEVQKPSELKCILFHTDILYFIDNKMQAEEKVLKEKLWNGKLEMNKNNPL